MTESEANRLCAMLFAAWPRAIPPETARETHDVYRAALRDLALDAAMRAVGECIRDCKFLPSVAEIRQRIEARAPRVSPPVKRLERGPGELDELSRLAREVAEKLS